MLVSDRKNFFCQRSGGGGGGGGGAPAPGAPLLPTPLARAVSIGAVTRAVSIAAMARAVSRAVGMAPVAMGIARAVNRAGGHSRSGNGHSCRGYGSE